MRKTFTYIFVTLLFMHIHLIGYCNPESDKANELFRETSQQAKMRADAEENPIACALFIAKTKLDGVYEELGLMHVARAYIKAERLEQAFQVAQMIKKDAVFKSSVLAEIAGKYAKAGQYDQAIQITKLVKVYPYDAEALTAIARAYVESGQFDQAIQVAETIKNDYSKALELTEIAVYYAKAGQNDKAFELFSRALQVTPKIEDLHYKNLAFDKIVDKSMETIEKDGALTILSQALQIAKMMEHDDYKNAMLCAIADKYVQLGQYDQALQLSKMITGNNNNKALLLAKIACHYAKAGQTNKASKILSQALQLAKKIKADYWYNKDTVLSDIASEYAESGLYGHAIQIVKTIENASSKIWALVDIARNYAKAGQIDKASLTLSQAIQVSKLVKDRISKSGALTKIGCAYAKLGLYNQALQVAEMIKDDSSKIWSLVEIARTYVATEQSDKASKVLFQAFQVAKEIKDASLLRVICEECVKAGQYDQAIEVAYTIEDTSDQAWFLAKIGDAYAKAGQKDKASKILTQALEVSEMIKDPHPTAKDRLLIKTAQAYAELGLYDQTLQAVKKIKDISTQVELLAEIGGEYVESGQKVDDRIKNLLHDIIREAEK